MVEDKNIKEVENTNAEWLKLQETLGQGRSVIGIDIGITSVDVAQVVLYKGKPTLIKTAVEPIEIFHERERENATITTLKRVLSQFHTKKADIVCVLSSRQIVVENMIMPLMPKEELFEAVHLEMMNSKRFNIENLIFDFQIAGRTIDNGIEKINVTVAAIDKSAVDNLLAKFMRQQAKPLAGLEADEKVESPVGLEVTSIIPLSIAIENIIKKSKVRTDEIVAIIEMGTMAAELNIYRNGQLELSRQLSVTGFMLSRSLMRAFFTEQGKVGLTMEEAEQIKKEYGIPAADADFVALGKISAQNILSLVRPGLEQLVQEIGRSFDYYRERLSAGKVDRLILFGGVARMKGLLEFLNAELGVSVCLGNPLSDVETLFDGVVLSQDDAPVLAKAIGAALSDCKGINLLPAHLKDRKKKSFERMIIAGVVILFLGILLSVYSGLSAKKTQAVKERDAVQKEYELLLPQVKDFEQELVLRKLARERACSCGLLKQLSVTPQEIYLTQLDFKEGQMTLSGFVLGKEKAAMDILNKWLLTLQECFLTNASIASQKPIVYKTDAVEFKITGTLLSGDAR